MTVIEELRRARREGRPPKVARPPIQRAKPAVSKCGSRKAKSPPPIHDGDVGTELTKIKPYIDVYTKTMCSGTFAKQMDKIGITRCRINMPRLLDWMKTAADETGTPFNRADAQVALLMAIGRAERKCR